MPHSTQDHFGNKSIPEHLKEARARGAKASAEIHGTEISGQKAAFGDALKDTALAASLLWILITPLLAEKSAIAFLLLFLLGWTVWKTCRSASFGWARLERLHRVIEEERWEIEHHRQQEKEELYELYRAKGFEGNLLNQVIDVLMADDNRLLQIMLEEELGLPLESYEHPLKQASGALLGSLLIVFFSIISYLLMPPMYLIGVLLFCFLAAGVFIAKTENIKLLPSFIWNIAIFALSTGLMYFIRQFIQ